MASKEVLVDLLFRLAALTRDLEEDRALLQTVLDVTDAVYARIQLMTDAGMGLRPDDYKVIDKKLTIMEKYAARVAYFNMEGDHLYQEVVRLSGAKVLPSRIMGNDIVDHAVLDESRLVQLTKPVLKMIIANLKGIDTIRDRMRKKAAQSISAAADAQKCLDSLEARWIPAPKSKGAS